MIVLEGNTRQRLDANTRQPNPARIYDWLLGGSHNFASDRRAGELMVQAVPAIVSLARENRAFLRRAVRYIVGAGVDQIIDIGAGIPTVGNTHEIARRINPAAKVVYVDYDPVAVAHARHVLEGLPGTGAIHGDVRRPEAIWRDSEVGRLVDPDRPTAVLLLSVLHFVRADVPDILSRIRTSLVAGGILAISHAVAPADTPSTAQAVPELEPILRDSGFSLHPRGIADIRQMFDGCTLVDPGLVPVDQWRPDSAPFTSQRNDAARCDSIVCGLGHLASAG